MEMLLRAGSDINAPNQKQHSPLQLAVAKPSKDCIAALLKHHLCNVNIQVWPDVFVVSCLCMWTFVLYWEKVRWMCGVKLKDRYPCRELRQRLGIDDMALVLQQNRLRWYGHVLWKEDDDWVKKCMEYEVEGPRPMGVVPEKGPLNRWVCTCVCGLIFCLATTQYFPVFSALTLLVGHQEEHLACKNWAMMCWCSYLSRVTCRLFALFAYGPADATASQTLSSLTSFKSRLVLPFRYRLTQVVLEKRPLNGCSSINSAITLTYIDRNDHFKKDRI